jgi:hypothetical protein
MVARFPKKFVRRLVFREILAEFIGHLRRIVIRERTNRFGERVRIRERICD